LVQGLPPACRALSHPQETEAPPTRPGAEAVASFLAAIVDHLVRTAAPKQRRPSRFDSLHDQWIHALRAGEEADDLARPADGQTRVGGEWTVRYLVQAADDPSLIVPVSGLWRPGSRESAVLERVRQARGFQPREFLLEALGRAARVDPQVETSLKSKTPGGYPLDARGAFEFLSQKAWLLEQAGFGVMRPAWWSRKGTKLRLASRAQVQSPKLRSAAGLPLDQVGGDGFGTGARITRNRSHGRPRGASRPSRSGASSAQAGGPSAGSTSCTASTSAPGWTAGDPMPGAVRS
ncbi:MAG TPA: SNF2 helicase-associated domain-containing protein, partial [Isosphaeraceae bacterium]|nr:SNF2 helicase-associated domain-containing protein [Isosphaeraceae bacterium]